MAEDNELDKLYPGIEKQVTFATAVTLTDLAKQAQAASIQNIEDKFTVRGNWAQPSNRYGIRISPATKDGLESSVHTAADWLTHHETGEDKKAEGGAIAVPTTETRPNIKDKITRGKRPRNVRGAFKLTNRRGVTSLFKRVNRKLKPLYRLVASARIEKRSPVIEPTVATVKKELNKSLGRNLTRAFKTQK